ncbi:MAG TPA: ATP-dependent DNA ligase [Chloroflexota bacterium]|nr:ATP-dependent DNA ligase [Chloroflexota bacterium]
MLLNELVATSARVAATSSRLGKVAAIAEVLRHAAGHEIRIAVSYLSGELRQRRVGVGWASLRDLPSPAAGPSLTVSDVDGVFSRIEAASGAGSVSVRRQEVAALFARATQEEQRFLARLIGGELRQGALAGIMADAVAKAAGVELPLVRRAAMLSGDLADVAEVALTEGVAGLARFRLRVGTALQPMLAQSASSVDEALDRAGPAALEWKLDGVRIQVHRRGQDVAVFTRTLDDITERVPEVVEAALALPVREVVLDGEAIALRPDGRPRPFQETGSRVASRADVSRLREQVPLTPYFFDALHIDGEDLLDLPGDQRYNTVARALPRDLWVPRLVAASVGDASAFLADAVARGHEGVLVKALASTYEAGRRGAGWIKVKPRHTLDLVVLAAEWGHGRRQGWLSNLHLGARDPATGGFVMLGKTFKGLTDEMLEWQTKRFQELEASRDSWTVYLRPELVVEIAFDGIQTSPRYPGQMALRFARVLRYRPDKPAGEADTVDTLRALHMAQIGASARGLEP